jgi:uncharacterized protein (DUF1778 family)
MPAAQKPAKTRQPSRPRKMERIDLRLRADQKDRIEMAAFFRGLSISDFVVQSADEAAKRAIEDHHVWTLRGEDAKAFIKMIENPPPPGPRLKKAFKQYAEEMKLRERKAN